MTNTKTGHSAKANRDGMTGVRMAWPEKIASSLEPSGTEPKPRWFTHSGVFKRVMQKWDLRPADMPENLAMILYRLVRQGYLERALKPAHIQPNYRPRREYVYRRTDKAFKPVKKLGLRNAPQAAIGKGLALWRDHGKLPKWFREMMK